MKKFLFIICSLFLLSTISSVSWALPPCPLDQNSHWHNCFGTYTWETGDKYEGEFQNGLGNGKGKYTHTSGSVYSGEWKDMKRHGQGVETWTNGDKYVGEHQNNKRNGQGTYNWGEGPNKGDKFIGFFKNNLRHGQGTYTFANGAKDVGEFKNSKLNGYAIRYDSDGIIYQEGIFKDDVFQYAQKKSSNSSNSNSKLNKYKEFCEEIGFKPGTEKFADCVLKTMEKD